MALSMESLPSIAPITVNEKGGALESAKQSLAAAKSAPLDGHDRQAKIKKSAQDFEAMFLSQMFGHMFKGLEVDPLFGGGEGEEMFRSFLVDEYSKLVSKAGGVGIANTVAKEFLSQQEVTTHE